MQGQRRESAGPPFPGGVFHPVPAAKPRRLLLKGEVPCALRASGGAPAYGRSARYLPRWSLFENSLKCNCGIFCAIWRCELFAETGGKSPRNRGFFPFQTYSGDCLPKANRRDLEMFAPGKARQAAGKAAKLLFRETLPDGRAWPFANWPFRRGKRRFRGAWP